MLFITIRLTLILLHESFNLTYFFRYVSRNSCYIYLLSVYVLALGRILSIIPQNLKMSSMGCLLTSRMVMILVAS